MSMEIVFPGGLKVDALYGEHRIRTDQPKNSGGEGSAPEPFALFLASIGTCAGIYVLNFCKKREISTAGLKLTMSIERNARSRMIDRIKIKIHLPEGFPDKYKGAVKSAADLCAVKKHILNPPEFSIVIDPA